MHTIFATSSIVIEHVRVLHMQHTQTRTHLAFTPVQEHMSPPTPLRIGVINQTLRCRLHSANTHMHTQHRKQNTADRLLSSKIVVSRGEFNVPIFGCKKKSQCTSCFSFYVTACKESTLPVCPSSSLPLICVILNLYSNNPLLSDVTRARHSWTLENFFLFFLH